MARAIVVGFLCALVSCGGRNEPARPLGARDLRAPRTEAARDLRAPRIETARDLRAPRIETARDLRAPRIETAREPVRLDAREAALESGAPAASRSELEVPGDGAAQARVDHDGLLQATDERFPLHTVAFHMLAQIFERPDTSSTVIGYMRRGATARASEVSRSAGCASGFHELLSGGFVCRERGFLIGRGPQRFEPSPSPPLLSAALPYAYAKNTRAHTLELWRIPTPSELAQAQALASTLTPGAESPEPPSTQAPNTSSASTPSFPAGAPVLEQPALPNDLVRRVLEPGFYVSLDQALGEPAAQDDQAYARTLRGALIEREALSPVVAQAQAGGALGPDEQLPIALVYRDATRAFRRDPISGALDAGRPLERFARLPLASEPVSIGNKLYRVSRAGEIVADARVRIASRVTRPALVPKHARLIHVSLAQQTLVAYEGERAVYAALVASGKPGFETPAGLFRIESKHVSATMDGLAGTTDVYSIEDVPWTLYFQGSYALHAAFWHDRFGTTRSHGCVNLAPADARWLFEWATPALPSGWHGVVATRSQPGTFVLIE